MLGGVPETALNIIEKISIGDVILLIESAGKDGNIPALCEIKIYHNVPLKELSHKIWGSPRFPYIFFFETKLINYKWGDFLEDLAYKKGYNPHGHFKRISPEHLIKFGGGAGYLKYILSNYSQ